TPPLADGVLDSITRRTVIGLLRCSPDIVVTERSIPRTELYVADEVFLCGTLDEVRPIISIDGLAVAEGPVMKHVRTTYLAMCRGEMTPLDDDMVHLIARVAGEDAG
ncbi:MAG: aminotransferase class IV, partial [Mycobacteriales bacterium]